MAGEEHDEPVIFGEQLEVARDERADRVVRRGVVEQRADLAAVGPARELEAVALEGRGRAAGVAGGVAEHWPGGVAIDADRDHDAAAARAVLRLARGLGCDVAVPGGDDGLSQHAGAPPATRATIQRPPAARHGELCCLPGHTCDGEQLRRFPS